jgi:Tfp pilus assembly protein PilF
VAVLANGEVDEGVKLAERALQIDKNDRIARLVLGVRAIKQKQYPVARRELAQSISGPITDLAATLLSAWTMASPSEAKQATDSIDKLAGADWYAIFKDLHAALILDVAGQKREAAKRFERCYKLDPTALRVVQSYGSFLVRQGNTAAAMKVFAAFDEALPRHPLIVEAVNDLKAGKKLPLMVDTPQAGAAEVLYGLGAALGRHGGEDLGLIYLQLSLYLAPSHPLALLSLGDLYEAIKKPELANKAYERVMLNSPLHRTEARTARPDSADRNGSSPAPRKTGLQPTGRHIFVCADQQGEISPARQRKIDLFAVQARARYQRSLLRVGGKVMTPADLRLLHKYMLEVENVSFISVEMRAVVESEWPELAHKLPPRR